MAIYNFTNVAAPTLLDGGITDVAVTLDVVSSTGYPAVPFKIRIDAEVIAVGAKASNTFSSLTREVDGTTKVAHSDQTQVEHVVTAEDIMPRFDAVTGDYAFGTGHLVVGTSGSGTGWIWAPQGLFSIKDWDEDDRFLIRGDGDISFTKDGGSTVSFLWDETDDQWEFNTDVVIVGAATDLSLDGGDITSIEDITMGGTLGFSGPGSDIGDAVNAVDNIYVTNIRDESGTLRWDVSGSLLAAGALVGELGIGMGATGDAQLYFLEGADDWYIQTGSNVDAYTTRLRFNTADHAAAHDIIFYDGDGTTVTSQWDESDDQWEFAKDVSIVGVLGGTITDPAAANHVGDRGYNDLRYADIALEHTKYTDGEAVSAVGTPWVALIAAEDHHTKYTDTEAAAKIAADDLYVQIAGDTMNGALTIDMNVAALFISGTDETNNDMANIHLVNNGGGTHDGDSWGISHRGSTAEQDLLFYYTDDSAGPSFANWMQFDFSADQIHLSKPLFLNANDLNLGGADDWNMNIAGDDFHIDEGAQVRLRIRDDENEGYFEFFSSDGTELLRLQADHAMVKSGSAGAPGWSWLSDTNTGFYWISTDNFGFSAGGSLRGRFTTSGFKGLTGSAGAPGYSFMNADDTGMYLSGTDLKLAEAGSLGLTIGANSVWTTYPISIGGNVSGTGSLFSTNTTGSQTEFDVSQASGEIYNTARVTSGLKYKDYPEVWPGLADIELRGTKHWRKDERMWKYGFIADWLAVQDLMLVNMGDFDEDGKRSVEAKNRDAVMAVMAEKIHRLEVLAKLVPEASTNNPTYSFTEPVRL